MQFPTVSLLLGLLALTAIAADTPAATPVPTGRGFTLIPKAFQSNPSLEMTVYTEMTQYGGQLPEVSPQQPVYFVAHSQGFKPLGEVAAGEKPPMPAELEGYLFQALEARGFRPAPETGPRPALALIYYWGSHNAIDPETAKNFPEMWRRDTLERAALVGGKKFVQRVVNILDFGAGPADQTLEMRNLLTQTAGDIYYVVVSAYAYDDLARNERRLAWRTTMTVTAYGVAMRTAMRPLVISAGDYFGRATPESVAIRRNAKDGTIKLGPLNVLETEVPETKPPAK